MLGTLGHALLTAGSLTDAVELAVTYWRLNGRYFEVAMQRSERDLRIRAIERMPLGPLRRFALESMMTAWIHAGRHLTSGTPTPAGVLLRFSLPYDPAYERYASRLPAVATPVRAGGSEPQQYSAARFADFLRRETRLWADAAHRAGVKPE